MNTATAQNALTTNALTGIDPPSLTDQRTMKAITREHYGSAENLQLSHAAHAIQPSAARVGHEHRERSRPRSARQDDRAGRDQTGDRPDLFAGRPAGRDARSRGGPGTRQGRRRNRVITYQAVQELQADHLCVSRAIGRLLSPDLPHLKQLSRSVRIAPGLTLLTASHNA